MMDKHIELVEKWLADPSSVSKEELKANYANATTAYNAAYSAAKAAGNAAGDGGWAAAATANYAAEWVAKYHKEVQAVARKKIIHDGGVVFDADGKTIDELKELLTPHIRRNDHE